jgi:hypothetical protein
MKRWMVALAVLVAAPRAFAQDKSWEQQIDDLKKQVEQLQKELADLKQQKDNLVKENDLLRKDVQGLRALSEESAREVLDLRARLKERGDVLPPNATERTGDPTQPKPDVGPEPVLRAKVWAVDAQFGFVIINKGEADGVLPGFKFDIMRRMPVGGDPAAKDWRWEKLGTGEFEKYVGQTKAQSKLKIIDGKAQDMKYEDEAVAHRKLGGSVEGGKIPIPAPGEKKFKIEGKVRDTYMLNYGQRDGAKQTDKVYVYRNNQLRATLRLDTVDKDWAIARLIDGTQAGDFGVGDEILLKEIRTAIVGRVKWNDEKRGIVIEAGLKNGVKPGMKFEVRRQGRAIGRVVVKKCMDYISECEPEDEKTLKREDVFVEDFVESIE